VGEEGGRRTRGQLGRQWGLTAARGTRQRHAQRLVGRVAEVWIRAFLRANINKYRGKYQGVIILFFSGTYAGKIEILGNPRITPLTTQIKCVLTIFFTYPPTIIQIKITLFYFRSFIVVKTFCKVFSLNVFLHLINTLN
jgi:hypothetical protein